MRDCKTNYDAVDDIGRRRLVEAIVKKVTKGGATVLDPDAIPDLCQYIYMSLLTDRKFLDVYNEGSENYYISRIVMNQVASKSSVFYRTYIKHKLKTKPFNANIFEENKEEDDEFEGCC